MAHHHQRLFVTGLWGLADVWGTWLIPMGWLCLCTWAGTALLPGFLIHLWARPSHDDGRSTRESKTSQHTCALSANTPRVNGEKSVAEPRDGHLTRPTAQKDTMKLHGKGHGESTGRRTGPFMESSTRCDELFTACTNIHVFECRKKNVRCPRLLKSALPLPITALFFPRLSPSCN